MIQCEVQSTARTIQLDLPLMQLPRNGFIYLAQLMPNKGSANQHNMTHGSMLHILPPCWVNGFLFMVHGRTVWIVTQTDDHQTCNNKRENQNAQQHTHARHDHTIICGLMFMTAKNRAFVYFFVIRHQHLSRASCSTVPYSHPITDLPYLALC